jgi:protein-tyrosine phosphatase
LPVANRGCGIPAYVNTAGMDHMIEVDSAGTHAYHIGNPPDHRAQSTALQRGYKMDELRARAVESSDFEEFDYILAMDKENLALTAAAQSAAACHGKIQLFMQYAPSAEADYRSARPVFRRAARI